MCKTRQETLPLAICLVVIIIFKTCEQSLALECLPGSIAYLSDWIGDNLNAPCIGSEQIDRVENQDAIRSKFDFSYLCNRNSRGDESISQRSNLRSRFSPVDNAWKCRCTSESRQLSARSILTRSKSLRRTTMLDDKSIWMELDRALDESGRSLRTAAEYAPESLTRHQLCGATPPQAL